MVDEDEPRPWDDTCAMASVFEARHSAQLPSWAVYFYDDELQYNSKHRWYGMELTALHNAGSILDIGCGSGEILRWYGVPPTYLGVDVVAALVKTAKAVHPARRFECLDVLSAPLSRFDTVIMVGLLGLSPRPLELIDRACRLTRTNLLFDFLIQEPGRRNSDRLHLRYLCRDEVVETLTRNGLTVVRTRRVGANLGLVTRRSSVE